MEQLLTVLDVSKLLKTNKQFVYKIIKDGKLKAITVGSMKIRYSDYIKYLDSLN